MTEDRSGTRPPVGVRHDTFTLSARLAASSAAVFDAFADPAMLRRWFKLPGRGARYDFDFRVGRGNSAQSTYTHPDGSQNHLEYWSRYVHIAHDRIVYAYESRVDEILHWTSLVTVQLQSHGAETELSWTEQVAFITPSDHAGDDLPHVRGATRLRLNGLAAALAPSAAGPLAV